MSGRSPGVGNGNPLHYSCLEHFMDRGAWQAAVHRVTESQTRPSTHALTHPHIHTRVFNSGAGLGLKWSEIIVIKEYFNTLVM